MLDRVLSIQSHVVSGYVGNKCVVFPLQVHGVEVDFINSVQFSNHTGYGKWKGQVLSNKDLGNDFDPNDLYQGLLINDLVNYTHINTGYIGSVDFLHKVKDVVLDIKKRNPECIYLCDPVLGDNGHFYVPESLIPVYVNHILPLAHITTPNTFELELLAKMKVKTEQDAFHAMKKLHDLGVRIVILSSLDSQDPILNTYGSYMEGKVQKVWKVSLNKLQGIYTGTGDLFAALFTVWYTKLGKKPSIIPDTLEKVAATMEHVLRRTEEEGLKVPNEIKSERKAPQELQLIQSIDFIRNPTVSNEAQVCQ